MHPLLGDVRKFMSEQSTLLTRCGGPMSIPEDDVIANSVRQRVDRLRRFLSHFSSMYSNLREIMIETGFHLTTH